MTFAAVRSPVDSQASSSQVTNLWPTSPPFHKYDTFWVSLHTKWVLDRYRYVANTIFNANGILRPTKLRHSATMATEMHQTCLRGRHETTNRH
jgi:hypothetical protein